MNPEKLLGGLMRMGMGRGMGMGTKAAVGMGALGVALAAFDHFTNQSQSSPTFSSSAPPRPTAPGNPTPPPYAGATPPPPPGASAATPPPPPPYAGAANNDDAAGQEAVLLIRAMIAAANADGVIDQDERNRILEKFQSADLDDDERSFILHELLSPADLETIVGLANTPELAQQVYAVSLLSIEADTEAEHTYLRTLAERLALDDDAIQNIHTQLGIA